jgi:hypothetical protein
LFNYYSATAGNFVILFLEFDAAVSAVSVTPYSPYASGMIVTAGPSIGNFYSFIAQIVGTSPYYMFNWTGSANLGVALEEYHGATKVSPTNYATATATSGTATASLTTDDSGGNMIVGGFGNAASNSFTATVGTLRQQNTSNACRCALIDNSNGSPGSLSCTATLTSSLWDVILLELRYLIGAVQDIAVVQPDRPDTGGINVGGTATDQAVGNYTHTVCFPYGQTYPRG